MRKFIALLLILCLCLPLTACKSKKQEPTPAKEFKYNILSDKAVIKKYNGEEKDVVIPQEIEKQPVTAISIEAFSRTEIESVIIPDSVEIIWEGGFWGCKSLEEVTFGKNVTKILGTAFFTCTSLKKIELPESLTEIGDKAFWGCSSIKKVHIPANVNKIGVEAFAGCPIEKLTIADGVKSFGSYGSFWDAELDELVIPASVTEIGEHIFNAGVEKVTFLGDAPTICGEYPFGENAVIYYKKGTTGWENTSLHDYYELIEK